MSRLPDNFPLPPPLYQSMRERLADLDPALRASLVIWTKAEIQRRWPDGRYDGEAERKARYSAGMVRHL